MSAENAEGYKALWLRVATAASIGALRAFQMFRPFRPKEAQGVAKAEV